uniref:Uncharacterized protein n=1 Tax=Odontella aurita TaxID=265563 RepID=A0A7S4J5N9_9STRA
MRAEPSRYVISSSFVKISISPRDVRVALRVARGGVFPPYLGVLGSNPGEDGIFRKPSTRRVECNGGGSLQQPQQTFKLWWADRVLLGTPTPSPALTAVLAVFFLLGQPID